MAKIYAKPIATGTDKCLILDPREAIIYPFNIGDWTEARLGFFVSMCHTIGDNTNAVNESVNADNPSNAWAIGLKNNDTNLPISSGAKFWGICPSTVTSINVSATNASGAHRTIVADGSTIIGTSASFHGNMYLNPGATLTSGFAYFLGLKFNITNKGLATQTVGMQYDSKATTYSDTSISALRARLVGFAPDSASGSSGLAWNTGTEAKAIPDTIFMRFPFANNRIRIHSLLIERFA